MTALAHFRSPLGPLSIEVTETGLCGLLLDPAGIRARPAVTARAQEHLDAARAALTDYFAGRPPLLPALDLHGSAFDLEVWSALVTIPYGETITYGELAARIGKPSAARAVGSANGRNPVAILVPCHRVVASGGGLGGYAGGLARKRWLLAHEAGHSRALR